ncbi:CHASE2 domain protein [Pseudodesulfovibrio hydrargyri]|uniref:CHASE2 domain protein n=1 Tax=Pseudodesulfovibrio hydrargyri TaxID=2125990 RepID=A0A1J5MUX4_9BACT|nr:CHASE2 domain-containing protein [Pseudodesulfovibrio hydrargyri]OIQ49628.1 CHASE2 domain protein [Pseudodesulfovibrio hydrargyri]
MARGLERRPRFNIALGTFALWIFTAIIWSYLDPLGLDAALMAYSQQIVDRVTAPFYDSPGQDRIAVVLIDDSTLEEWKVGWPPPYDRYTTLLYRVLRQKPKAVFMDIMLERLRPRDEDSFKRAHATLTRMKLDIPVILARSGPDAPNLFADVPGVDTAVVSWRTPEYPLWDARADAPTPAPQLYRHLCGDTRDRALGCYKGVDPARGQPMAVQWGCAVSATMRDQGLLPEGAFFVAPNWGERLLRACGLLWRSLLVGLDRDSMEKARERLPYAVTVRAQDLDKVRGLLTDRAVLIGTALTGSNDLVQTPVNGQLPGVYYHAMALDNLTNYGPRYFTNPPQNILLFLSITVLMSALSAAMYVHHGRLGLRYLCLSWVLILCLMIGSYGLFKLAPPNWLGYWLLATLAAKLQSPCLTASDIRKCIGDAHA